MPVIKLLAREANLRRRVRAHFRKLGFTRDSNGDLLPPNLDKVGYREMHTPQRVERLHEESKFLAANTASLIEHFATGKQIELDCLTVRLELVEQATWQSDLFRFATLLWSIPVSRGFGRRMRFLVWDDHTRKLMGIFALGDPVFNLGARDQLVGWSSDERAERLVSILDGYVVGAVPPFNRVLGGKLVASLMRTREVMETFRERYGATEGIISGTAKNAHLVAVTTTSALGRSAVYNRLKLDGVPYLDSIGFTGGFGHFHFPRDLFEEMRSYLKHLKDPYADNHQFGDGPNWRLRCIRQSLSSLGMDPNLVRHGLSREVFMGQLADNALDILRGRRKRPDYKSLLPAADVARLAAARWMLPRSARDESFRLVTREDVLKQIQSIAIRPTILRKLANA